MPLGYPLRPMRDPILLAETALAAAADSAHEGSSIGPGLMLTIFCAAIGVASLAGGAVVASLHLGHRRLQLALSFVAGTMLGVGLLHLLPHGIIIALESRAAGAELSHGLLHGALDGVMLALVLGFVAMFLLERFFHFHQHETPEEAGHHDCCEDGCEAGAAVNAAPGPSDAVRGRAHRPHERGRQSHGLGHGHGHAKPGPKPLSELGWLGAAIGLTLHSLLEGIAMGAAVLAGAAHGEGAAIAGLSTFLVILLHKPFDGLTVTTLVRAAGRPRAFAHVVNAIFALVVPIGAGILWFGVSEHGAQLLPYALAFSAGTFLCIASSDLLPELQFHRHDRLALSAALLLGLAAAATIARIESSVAQTHDHGHDHAGEHGHDHDDGHLAPGAAEPSVEPARGHAPGDAHDHDH